MKYLCLVCAETLLEGMPKPEAESHYAEYERFIEEVRRSGHLLGRNRLRPPETALTVRVRGGKTSVTDGPFAETKEQLGGYFLIEATDLNEAIQVAARIPGAKMGCVEVRPVAEDEAPPGAAERSG